MKNKLILFILVSVLTLCAALASCTSASNKPAVPDDVTDYYVNYMELSKTDAGAAFDMTNVPIDMKDIYTHGTKTLDYYIVASEKVNDNLYSFTSLCENNAREYYYFKAFNFVGKIDGEWKVIVHQDYIPDDLRENFDGSKYVYENPDYLGTVMDEEPQG